MDRENSIVRIILPSEHGLKLKFFQLPLQPDELPFQFLFQVQILFFSEKLLQGSCFLVCADEPTPPLFFVFEVGQLLKKLGPIFSFPKISPGGFFLQLLYSRSILSCVKDTP